MDKKNTPSCQSVDVRTLLATLCYLMSRHAENPSQELANVISDHFSIMQSEGEAGHSKCSEIIEDAIQEKVKIIRRG